MNKESNIDRLVEFLTEQYSSSLAAYNDALDEFDYFETGEVIEKQIIKKYEGKKYQYIYKYSKIYVPGAGRKYKYRKIEDSEISKIDCEKYLYIIKLEQDIKYWKG